VVLRSVLVPAAFVAAVIFSTPNYFVWSVDDLFVRSLADPLGRLIVDQARPSRRATASRLFASCAEGRCRLTLGAAPGLLRQRLGNPKR
jgi:hypothetical protein